MEVKRNTGWRRGETQCHASLLILHSNIKLLKPCSISNYAMLCDPCGDCAHIHSCVALHLMCTNTSTSLHPFARLTRGQLKHKVREPLCSGAFMTVYFQMEEGSGGTFMWTLHQEATQGTHEPPTSVSSKYIFVTRLKTLTST